MPININDIISSNPVDPPAVLLIVLLLISLVCFICVKFVFDPNKTDDGRLFVASAVGFMGILFSIFISSFSYFDAQFVRIEALSSSIKENYNLDISEQIAQSLLSERGLPVKISQGQDFYTIDILDDGSVIVTDSHGNLVDSK